MHELTSRGAVDVPRRTPWEGLGKHGFGYMDSLADTGGTLVPRSSLLAGSTGTFGDPRRETVTGTTDEFAIFARAATHIVISALDPAIHWDADDDAYEWDVITITPLRLPLRRPDAVPAVVVALEEVLNTLRAQAGLPVGDLAAMLGVSRRQFYNWIGRENEPDTDQEQRIRRSAALVADSYRLHGDPRSVRATLLATTVHGSAFDALKAGDLETAQAALSVLTVGHLPRDAVAPSQRRPYDRERVLLELNHLRDTPLRGDD